MNERGRVHGRKEDRRTDRPTPTDIDHGCMMLTTASDVSLN